MASNVVALGKPTVDEANRKKIVAYLEEFLEHAKAGKIDGGLFIFKAPNGLWTDTVFGDDIPISEMVGKVEIAKQRWIAACLSNDENKKFGEEI